MSLYDVREPSLKDKLQAQEQAEVLRLQKEKEDEEKKKVIKKSAKKK